MRAQSGPTPPNWDYPLPVIFICWAEEPAVPDRVEIRVMSFVWISGISQQHISEITTEANVSHEAKNGRWLSRMIIFSL